MYHFCRKALVGQLAVRNRLGPCKSAHQRTPESALSCAREVCILSMPGSIRSWLAHAVPVRTVGEQAYRIRELRVRFFRADMMFKPSHEV